MYTYFIHSPKLESVKIGRSIKPLDRLESLKSGNPDELQILGTIDGDCEKEFHKRFREYRIRGEWFYLGPKLMDFLEIEFKFGLHPFVVTRDLGGLLTAADVAARLALKESWVARLNIPFVRVGWVKCYRNEDVDAFIESLESRPAKLNT